MAAIYCFARTADDIADEGDALPDARLAALAAYRADLLATASCGGASVRWPTVFEPLRPVLVRHRLPLRLLTDLLSAFEQDVWKCGYATRDDLLDYCRRSANPVGRLMLHLFKIEDPTALNQSDAICTALQLANFWQDLGPDLARRRYYVPDEDCTLHRIAPQRSWERRDTPASRALMTELVRWARSLMLSGAPLVHRLNGRSGWELRLVVQGGLRILERIDQLQGATLETRPVLTPRDAAPMLWLALKMRPNRAIAAAA